MAVGEPCSRSAPQARASGPVRGAHARPRTHSRARAIGPAQPQEAAREGEDRRRRGGNSRLSGRDARCSLGVRAGMCARTSPVNIAERRACRRSRSALEVPGPGRASVSPVSCRGVLFISFRDRPFNFPSAREGEPLVSLLCSRRPSVVGTVDCAWAWAVVDTGVPRAACGPPAAAGRY